MLEDKKAVGVSTVASRSLNHARPCSQVTEILFGYLSSAWTYMAMADYPYSASFLGYVYCGWCVVHPLVNDCNCHMQCHAALASQSSLQCIYQRDSGPSGRLQSSLCVLQLLRSCRCAEGSYVVIGQQRMASLFRSLQQHHPSRAVQSWRQRLELPVLHGNVDAVCTGWCR